MLDIVLINFNTRELTVNCIESIYKFTSVPFNLFVVDNASVDDSVEAISWRFPGATVIQNRENEGYARAFNKGARMGNNPYILALNSDTAFADPEWAQKMISVFESDPKIASVSPRLINEKNQLTGVGVVGTNAKPQIRGWMEQHDPNKYNTQIECVSVCGAVMMIKRSNISVLGLFDERYPFYFEETDYNYNARDKGFKVVYTPSTTVYHYHQGSSKDHGKLGKYFQIGKKIFDEKFKHMMDDTRVYR